MHNSIIRFWRSKYKWILWVFISISIPAVSSALDCQNPSGAKECLECVLLNDPDILAAGAEVEKARGNLKSAGTWENPEVEGEMAVNPRDSSTTGFVLEAKQPISLAGKIGSQRRAARYLLQAAEARYKMARQEAVAGTVLRLVRLRQIDEERELIKSQQDLGKRALARFSKISFLTADQEASEFTFQWNQDGLTMQLAAIDAEVEEIKQEIITSFGGKEPSKWDFLVLEKTSWPDWPGVVVEESLPLQIAKYETEAAKANLKTAKAEAWPDISVGPVIESGTSAGIRETMVGGGIEFAFPIWNRNKGAVMSSKAEVEQGKRSLKSTENWLVRRAKLLKERYEKFVSILSKQRTRLGRGKERLGKVKSSYLGGRIPVSTAFEAFGQYHEAVEAAHELESRAYESLWESYVLVGTAERMTP